MSRKPQNSHLMEEPCAPFSPVEQTHGPWDAKGETGRISYESSTLSVGLNNSDDFFDSRSLQFGMPSTRGTSTAATDASSPPAVEPGKSQRRFHPPPSSVETPELPQSRAIPSSRSVANTNSCVAPCIGRTTPSTQSPRPHPAKENIPARCPQPSRTTGDADFYFAPRRDRATPSGRSPRLNPVKENFCTFDSQSTASSRTSPPPSVGVGYSTDSGSTAESVGPASGGVLWETPTMTRHARREWRCSDSYRDPSATPQSIISESARRLLKEPDPNFSAMGFSPGGQPTGTRGDIEKSPRMGPSERPTRHFAHGSNSRADGANSSITRFCSTGSLFNVTGTIVAPNTRKLIGAVAAILLDQMEEDQNTVVDDIPEFHMFDEEYYLSQGAGDCPVKSALTERLREAPEEDEIGAFITSLYEAAEFSPECNILCLLYINRLMAFTGMPLLHRNWRPLVFTALILAQKVWDDKFLGNADFAAIYPFFSKEEINRMEAAFLKLVQYEVVVKPSTYAQYYFELRSMFQDGEEFPSEHPRVIANSGLESRSILLAERLSGRGVEDKSLTSI